MKNPRHRSSSHPRSRRPTSRRSVRLRRDRPTGRTGVMLGHLTELVVVTSSGDRSMSAGRLRGKYLAWMPKLRNFAIVQNAANRSPRASITSKDREVFRKFHKGEPRKAVSYEWPDKHGSLVELGRLRSLTYVVTSDIPSPQKRGVRWVHAFGDHGELGHGEHTGEVKTYPKRLMPVLAKDAAGNLFIIRKPGNRYDVTEWIYW